jgi:hypothetical protein
MSTATQQTEVRTVFLRCRLGKSELNRLFSLAPEGIPAASVVVSTQRDNTRYADATLTNLVDHVRNSNAAGNLDVWTNLTLEAADGAGDRRITVVIDTERTEVQVSGRDATWVHGQAARIELFLDGTGGETKSESPSGKFRARSLPLNIASLLLGIAIAAGISAVAPGVIEFASPKNTLKVLLGATIGTVPFFLAILALLAVLNRIDRAVLMPTMDIPHGSWWGRASNADKIALGSLVIATLSFFVALFTLGKDLMK